MSKIRAWLVDYGHMIRGVSAMYVYRKPPKHYLDFVLPDKAPVILLPGFFEKWAFLKKLGDYLSAEGHPIYIVPSLGHNIADVPSAANKLRAVVAEVIPALGHHLPNVHIGALKIRELLENFDMRGAVIVAHSKGGLIGKYYLAHYNQNHRIKGMVAVATPFAGSALAKLVPHRSFRELTATHKIIMDLEKHRAINHKIISIYPVFDNHIWTAGASILAGAKNIQVEIHGHHKVLFDKQVKQLIIKSINELAKAPKN